MAPPSPRVNTFLQKNDRNIIDRVSKIFITTVLILGVNRLSIFGITNNIHKIFFLFYFVLINALLIFVIRIILTNNIYDCLVIENYFQYLICTIVGYLCHEKLLNFYRVLSKFDQDIGLRPTNCRYGWYILLQALLTILLSAVVYWYNYKDAILQTCMFVTEFLRCIELHFYGHLCSLLIPRLRIIKNNMMLSYPNKINGCKSNKNIDDEFKYFKNKQHHHIEMKDLMEQYNKIIIAYDSLNEAVRWQMFILLILTFIAFLGLCYFIANCILWQDISNNEKVFNWAYSTSLLFVTVWRASMQLLPLLVPCVCAERVHSEVHQIRELLASKLYENTLDKASRSSGRALLALIETRGLSFSLFHMFNIDISLPFKFLGLSFTYLIILLQFDRVINPNSPH